MSLTPGILLKKGELPYRGGVANGERDVVGGGMERKIEFRLSRPILAVSVQLQLLM